MTAEIILLKPDTTTDTAFDIELLITDTIVDHADVIALRIELMIDDAIDSIFEKPDDTFDTMLDINDDTAETILDHVEDMKLLIALIVDVIKLSTAEKPDDTTVLIRLIDVVKTVLTAVHIAASPVCNPLKICSPTVTIVVNPVISDCLIISITATNAAFVISQPTINAFLNVSFVFHR